MPYSVTYSNIVHGFTPSVTYNTLPSNLVRVLPLGHIIWSSYSPALKYLLVHLYNYLVEYLYSSLMDLVLSHSTPPKLFLLCLALDYTYMPILLVEDPILSYTYSSKLYIDYDVPY